MPNDLLKSVIEEHVYFYAKSASSYRPNYTDNQAVIVGVVSGQIQHTQLLHSLSQLQQLPYEQLEQLKQHLNEEHVQQNQQLMLVDRHKLLLTETRHVQQSHCIEKFYKQDIKLLRPICPGELRFPLRIASDLPSTVCGLLLLALAVSIIAGSAGANPSITGIPCVYEGQLRTEKNWYGYLANLSIMTTGRMTFEFSYAADRCCQNILFYSEDQMSIISARMNCWQKEYLLRPEEDQILRLTPRFSWSGCHMTHPNGIATYICEGGRSFTVDQPASRPMTWYVAVSNCATLAGLDLQYRLVVYGHIGDCRSRATAEGILGSSSMVDPNSPRAQIVSGDSSSFGDSNAVSDALCILDGDLNTTTNWYGFLANVSLARGGGFRFRFKYPSAMQEENVILYSEEDIMKLNHEQSCWQKEGIIKSRNVQDQILNLSVRSSVNGCLTKNSTTGGVRMLECQGERRYEDARKMFIAIDNCRSLNGLVLGYHIEIHGYNANDGGVCSGASSLSFASIPHSGLTKLTAIIFFFFFFFYFTHWTLLSSLLLLRIGNL